MIYFIIALLVLLALIILAIVLILNKTTQKTKSETKESIINHLDKIGFFAKESIFINRHLSLAYNKNYSKLVVIENFHPAMPNSGTYEEIVSSFINSIEKNHFGLKINYTKKGEKNTLYINPVNNEIKNFIYTFFKEINIRKIQNKFDKQNFNLFATSDWICSYIWEYNEKNSHFAYLKTGEKPIFKILNLRKEHFTLDIKYNYLELPIEGIRQQLLVYNNNFLNDLYNALFEHISQKAGCICENMIYYDSFNNIVYITNGTSSLQSLIIDKIEEVYYKDNSLYFSLYDEGNINFFASQKLIFAFEEFIIGYNLRKIALSFDYTTDKLINTTDYTKFIIDITRNRIVYCANLNKLGKFSYLTIPFEEINEVSIEHYNKKPFIRITTINDEIIDVSCTKPEIAHYIEAQLKNTLLLN